jgi:hypothetical protein
MIAPPTASKGETAGPKSRTKPVFFEVLCQVTVVPTFTQNGAFAFAFCELGVTEAEVLPLRLTSMRQGLEGDPQVFAALQMLAGFDSEQRYLSALLFCPLAAKRLAHNSASRRTPNQIFLPAEICTTNLPSGKQKELLGPILHFK